ncbi:hypothetical protein L345_14974, partial [Ophiophagus hannah]
MFRNDSQQKTRRYIYIHHIFSYMKYHLKKETFVSITNDLFNTNFSKSESPSAAEKLAGLQGSQKRGGGRGLRWRDWRAQQCFFFFSNMQREQLDEDLFLSIGGVGILRCKNRSLLYAEKILKAGELQAVLDGSQRGPLIYREAILVELEAGCGDVSVWRGAEEPKQPVVVHCLISDMYFAFLLKLAARFPLRWTRICFTFPKSQQKNQWVLPQWISSVPSLGEDAFELLISKPDPCLQLDWEEVSQMADLQTLKGKDTIDQGIVNFEDLTVVGKVFLFLTKESFYYVLLGYIICNCCPADFITSHFQAAELPLLNQRLFLK